MEYACVRVHAKIVKFMLLPVMIACCVSLAKTSMNGETILLCINQPCIKVIYIIDMYTHSSIDRFSRNKRVCLCMDGDEAGNRAVARLCESSILRDLSEEGYYFRVADIAAATQGSSCKCKDPSDFIQACGGGVSAGKAFRSEVIMTAKPWTIW